MKKILLTAMAVIFSTPVHAASLYVDLRADHSSQSYLHSTQEDKSRFMFKTARLDLQGAINEDLKYRFRSGYNSNNDVNDIDSIENGVSLAYIEHKLTDGLYLQAGKVNTEIGGFEAATSGPDIYLRSKTYGFRTPQGALNSELNSTAAMLYLTGAKLTYKFDNQSITYLLANYRDKDNTEIKNRNTHGLIWKGKFLDKSLDLNASTHYAEGPDRSDSQHYYALGAIYSFDKFILSADYLFTTLIQDSTDNKDSIHTLFTKLTYLINDKLKARLDLEYSTTALEVNSNGVKNESQYLGYAAIFEFYPYPDQVFRYHLAYSETRTLETDIGDKGVEREMMAGIRIFADLLK